ncbi:hypothetical protein MRX96_025465 [Rhipicephalus microplus]
MCRQSRWTPLRLLGTPFHAAALFAEDAPLYTRGFVSPISRPPGHLSTCREEQVPGIGIAPANRGPRCGRISRRDASRTRRLRRSAKGVSRGRSR